jgi:antitoxin (DNA-binding transcriptional repressor) of toxin-antitoxin stability system
MDFITVRDLRLRPAQIWQRLRQQGDLILTSGGRPIALLVALEGEDVADTLAAVRRARAQLAVSRLRQASAAQHLDRLTAEEIEAEIGAAREARRQ